MQDMLLGIAQNLLSRLADKTVVRLSVRELEYDFIRNDPGDILVVITPNPSRYYARVGFSHRGKPTTIRDLTLSIDGRLNLKAEGFNGLRLEHGDYREETLVFPVEKSNAVDSGWYEIKAIATFDKVIARCKGRFPVHNT